MQKTHLLIKALFIQFFCLLSLSASTQNLEFTFHTPKGGGDDPMIVVWLERTDDEGSRQFIKTLALFSHDHKYYKELKLWRSRNTKIEKKADVDAIVGPTIQWSKKRTLILPINMDNRNLLDGSYMIRIESGKDKGKHYKTFKFELDKEFKGGSFKHSGYVNKVDIKIIEIK